MLLELHTSAPSRRARDSLKSVHRGALLPTVLGETETERLRHTFCNRNLRAVSSPPCSRTRRRCRPSSRPLHLTPGRSGWHQVVVADELTRKDFILSMVAPPTIRSKQREPPSLDVPGVAVDFRFRARSVDRARYSTRTYGGQSSALYNSIRPGHDVSVETERYLPWQFGGKWSVMGVLDDLE